jgi:CMP-N-acetylneuraminic acid synthetase
MHPEGHICLLYMTYIKRLDVDIDKMVDYYLLAPDRALIGLIADEPMHPYRFLEYKSSSDRVTEIFQNQTHITRRQEYPVMFPFSHYCCMFPLESLTEMSPNLIGARSRPYWLTKAQCADMDTVDDMHYVAQVRGEYYEKLLGGPRDA